VGGLIRLVLLHGRCSDANASGSHTNPQQCLRCLLCDCLNAMNCHRIGMGVCLHDHQTKSHNVCPKWLRQIALLLSIPFMSLALSWRGPPKRTSWLSCESRGTNKIYLEQIERSYLSMDPKSLDIGAKFAMRTKSHKVLWLVREPTLSSLVGWRAIAGPTWWKWGSWKFITFRDLINVVKSFNCIN
jgi:hypothetical protein